MSKKTNNYVAFFFFLNRLILLKHKEDNLSHAGIHLPLLTYSLFPLAVRHSASHCTNSAILYCRFY